MSWFSYNSEAGYVTRYPMHLASVPNIVFDRLSTLLLFKFGTSYSNQLSLTSEAPNFDIQGT